MLAELERLAPEVVSCCRAALEQDTADLEFHRLEREAFAKCPNVAIDVAVMEKTELGSVLPLDAGWSDVAAGALSGKPLRTAIPKGMWCRAT
jgi:mannose-1-phosphate guanylyltransferase